jgi:hypothetical protein
MTAELPNGTRAERIAFARKWLRERRAGEASVRLSQLQRRLIVVGLYVLLAATISALAAGTAKVAVAIVVALVVAQVISYLLLNYAVRAVFAGRWLFDERERELRYHAATIAYMILATAIGLLSAYAIFAPQLKFALPNLLLALIVLSWLAFSLPQAVFAWTLPDAE